MKGNLSVSYFSITYHLWSGCTVYGKNIVIVCLSVCIGQPRDSGDEEDMEKNSEDEEGQLEEQIDRLQEKVESAQSEQKNLFLVIFQVGIFLLTPEIVLGTL